MDHNYSLIKALINTLQVEVETLDNDTEDLPNEPIDLTEKVRDYEARLIKAALQKTRGNQRQAAVLLNVKPTTLNIKIKQLGIPLYRNLRESGAV